MPWGCIGLVTPALHRTAELGLYCRTGDGPTMTPELIRDADIVLSEYRAKIAAFCASTLERRWAGHFSANPAGLTAWFIFEIRC